MGTLLHGINAGNDVFVVFPTGFGKSLCYACLPGVFERVLGAESVVVVLSPLTAIMRDQVSIIIIQTVTGESLKHR